VSVLGPVLFLLYVADLLQLILHHQLVRHTFDDDTQIYGFCKSCDAIALSDRMSACADVVMSWMKASRLRANPSKPEVLWHLSDRRHSSAPDTYHVGTNQDHRRAAGHLGLRPRHVHGLRHHYADACDSHREIMFLCASATSQCAMMPLGARLDVTQLNLSR